MEKKIPIGVDNFEEVRERDFFYVDKTDVIEELITNGSKVKLFPRPRRFGKSLFLSMIECYFNVEKKEKVEDLFRGLNVEKSEYTLEHRSKYPVILITFKGIKCDNAKDTMIAIKERMSMLYKKNKFLYDVLDKDELMFFSKIEDKSATDFECSLALQKLTVYLERYYGEKTIMLIDEYDAPIDNAFNKGFYLDIIDFFKSMYNDALKGNNSLNFACMTGVVRVSSESMFSDLNHITVYGIMQRKFSEYFGFTEKEVKEALEYYGLSDSFSDVKQWYDGYKFGDNEIYNPWSILNFIDNEKLDPYWVNTGENSLLNKLINSSTVNIKPYLIRLLNGEEIETEIDEKISYKSFSYTNNEALTMLLLTGYLTVVEECREERRKYYILKIPNEEVMIELEKSLVAWSNNLGDKDLLEDFKESLLSGNEALMEASLNEIMLSSISYYDNAENFYHGFVLGLLLNLGSQYYYKSNRESGFGRYDIMIEAKDKTFGCVIEFKYAKEESLLDSKLNQAIEQIEKREYTKELVERKIEKIYKYAIAINEKKAKVKKLV